MIQREKELLEKIIKNIKSQQEQKFETYLILVYIDGVITLTQNNVSDEFIQKIYLIRYYIKLSKKI